MCYPLDNMNAKRQTSQNLGELPSLWQWLNVNPPVNLIQLIVGGCLLILIWAYYGGAIATIPWRIGTALILLGAIWAATRWVAHRYGDAPGIKISLLWIGITLVLSEAITIISAGEFPRILYTIMPIIAVFCLPGRWSLAITIGTLFWVMLSVRLFPIPEIRLQSLVIVLTLATYLGGYALAYALLQEGRARKETQHLLRELADSNEQLTRYAAEAAQLATIRERNRIAREIHDSLGHYLTIVGVQLEKAITFEAVNREETAQAMRAAKHLTDQALNEVRQSVGALRDTDDAFTLQMALQALAQNVAQSGLDVDLRWRGDENGFSEKQLFTLFRAAQEGLTNVQKHAQAQQVQLNVSLDAETAVLQLTDDGIGFDPETIQPGRYGLQGLRERIELVQGALTLQRGPTGGTQLVVTIPKEESKQAYE
ncbi:MAG: sensor histidine kinase [Anaerolineaceae bacterium]|nr:sensor histidine kinase [Anaerolineaceae bacterium]